MKKTAETARQVTRDVTEGAQRVAAAPLTTGLFFWDWMLGLPERQQERSLSQSSSGQAVARTGNGSFSGEEVIPLAEETLVVGKRTVESGTTRIRRYVVETPVEQEVSLSDEKVVVERRRPVTNASTGETLDGADDRGGRDNRDPRCRQERAYPRGDRRPQGAHEADCEGARHRPAGRGAIEQPTKKLATRQYART